VHFAQWWAVTCSSLPAGVALTLAACGQEIVAPAGARPALVVCPQPAEAAADGYRRKERASGNHAEYAVCLHRRWVVAGGQALFALAVDSVRDVPSAWWNSSEYLRLVQDASRTRSERPG